MEHPKLQAVIDALEALFSDTSVYPETTLDALEEVRDWLDVLIKAIQAKLKK